jgi:hypothetical protein
VLLATTKEGTNSFHGLLYEDFRNRILNARSFFQPSNNARYVQNDPGFNIGGPVLLPHYNGRDKTFFFIAYDKTLVAQPSPTLALVPSALERSGNFSQRRTVLVLRIASVADN